MSQRYNSVAFPGSREMSGSASLLVQPPYTSDPGLPHFDDPDLLYAVRRLDVGSYLLLESEFSGLDPRGLNCHFIEDEELGRGREESRRDESDRKLRFGQLLLSSEADYEATQLVAVKPFDHASEAVHEYLVTAYLNQSTTPTRPYSSYRPLGFYAYSNGGGTALITEYDESVISYDNLFWNEEREPTEEEAKKAVANIALGLSHYHELAVSFDDSQLKNFAADNKGPRHIDPESARSLVGRRGQVDPLESYRRISNNIGTLFRSFHVFDGDDYSDMLEGVFNPLYLERLNSDESRIPEEGRVSERDLEALLSLSS